MIVEKIARDTLTAVELDRGDELRFQMGDGSVRRIVLEHTSSAVHSTTLADLKKPQHGARSEFRSHCQLRIDGTAVQLVRWFGNQLSFNPPWELFGLRIWFDGTQDLFDLMLETHGPCKPRKHARFAFQDAARRICPVLLHPWCPLPDGGLRIEQCYFKVREPGAAEGEEIPLDPWILFRQMYEDRRQTTAPRADLPGAVR